jgi:hypothetical protein
MRTVVFLGLVLALAGCMTVTHGNMQTIEVATSPPGARVTIRPGGVDATSPARVTVHRKGEGTVNVAAAGGDPEATYLVTASMPGYKDATVALTRKASGEVYTRNIIWVHPLLWGLGVAIDFSSGAAYELAPSNILLTLEPAPTK